MHIVQSDAANHMGKATISKGNVIGRPAHEMNRFVTSLCQSAAEGQCLQVNVEANPLGRLVGLKEPQRLARTTADVQHLRFGSERGKVQKSIQETARSALRRLDGKLGAV